jgi:hypothetical protein
MKGFVVVKDDDWFIFLYTAATFTENSPSQRWRINPPDKQRAILELKSVNSIRTLPS